MDSMNNPTSGLKNIVTGEKTQGWRKEVVENMLWYAKYFIKGGKKRACYN